MQIVPLEEALVGKVREFTDRTIGAGYYSEAALIESCRRSQSKSISGDAVFFSYVLVNDTGEVLGLRLTYPPGQWAHQKRLRRSVSPKKWNSKLEETAYFQSVFIAPELRGEGWGPKLSHLSLKKLIEAGAKAVVCHSWKESPGNSSTKYLKRLGFEEISEYPKFWIDVDYQCTRCGSPCVCTATEMIKYL